MEVENFKQFSFRINVHPYESGHVASGHFVLGRDVLCEFDYWPLAVSMPPRYARSVKMLYL